jgi:hypothetical protein
VFVEQINSAHITKSLIEIYQANFPDRNVYSLAHHLSQYVVRRKDRNDFSQFQGHTGFGRAMAEADSPPPVTAEARVHS